MTIRPLPEPILNRRLPTIPLPTGLPTDIIVDDARRSHVSQMRQRLGKSDGLSIRSYSVRVNRSRSAQDTNVGILKVREEPRNALVPTL
jgi:hypothetical protein